MPCKLELEPWFVEVGGLANGNTDDALGGGLPRGEAMPAAAARRPEKGAPGSIGHEAGVCRPCAWVHKMPGGKGCKNGSSCKYCHLCPPGELKRRKREKWEQLVPSATSTTAATPTELSEVGHESL